MAYLAKKRVRSVVALVLKCADVPVSMKYIYVHYRLNKISYWYRGRNVLSCAFVRGQC